MGLHFDVVDVFTDRPYAGNPLAVVRAEDLVLDAAAMQRIAGEFHLSETVFTLPPTTSGADYRVRIFTPAVELPFAGHPSVGAAWVLARDGAVRHGEVVQECGAGLLPVRVDADGARVAGGRPEVGEDLETPLLAAAAGLTADDVDGAAVPGIAAAGVPFAFLLVRADAVARAAPDPAAVAALGQTGLVVVSFEGDAAHLRMFGAGVGVAEDPATGSAAVALGVFLTDRGLLPGDGEAAFTVWQGAEIGRPSRLEVTVRAEGGTAVWTTVRGGVVAVSRGALVALP
jgi:trans-2,3-dihydro-3-hydroxyanthranilate isomerase